METSEHKKALNRERCRRWRLAHPERKKEQAKRWEEKNPEYYQKYYQKNEERIRARVKKWGEENPELKASYDRKRRAIKYATRSEPYTDSQALEKWGTVCYLCNEEIDMLVSGRPGHEQGWEKGLNLDHVIPLTSGGTDTLDNVRPTHAICNLKKPHNFQETTNAGL
jgi:hypothetical protein